MVAERFRVENLNTSRFTKTRGKAEETSVHPSNFLRRVELSNQVYMQYEQTASGNRDLKIKVLDMGQGQERAAWFSQGVPNSFESTFPDVIKKLRKEQESGTTKNSKKHSQSSHPTQDY